MDMVEFLDKFGVGNKEDRCEYIGKYFGENNIVYCIMKEHNILNGDIVKSYLRENSIEYTIKNTDTEELKLALKELNTLSIEYYNETLEINADFNEDKQEGKILFTKVF